VQVFEIGRTLHLKILALVRLRQVGCALAWQAAEKDFQAARNAP
jgi:hypothetical protein